MKMSLVASYTLKLDPDIFVSYQFSDISYAIGSLLSDAVRI